MSLDYLNDAFKKLDRIVLSEETFNTSYTGINDLATFMDQDDDTDLIKVIDPDVQDDMELSDSYVGKVITNCNVCHSNIFNNKEDIVIDEDGVVNIEKQCPYCGEFSGFTILGEITPFNPDATTEEDASTEVEPTVEVDGETVEDTTPPEEEEVVEQLEESLETCGPDSIESYLNDVEDGEGWVTVEKAVSDLETLGCAKTEEEVKEFVSNYNRAYLLTFAGIDIIFTPTAPSYETVGKELGIDEDSLTESINNTKRTINETRVRNFKPHTIRLLKLIGSDLVADMDECLTEAMNNVNVETDDTIVTVNSDENGKVTVSTEPKVDETPIEETEEMITPISDETLADIEANQETPEGEEIPAEEAPIEAEELDLDFEDVDEEALDELGESYFKKVYENIDSYKTTGVSLTPTKFIVEGLLKFNSGTEKKTGFIFEAHAADKDGKIKFLGENAQLSRGKRAFGLIGKICDKKFLPESFSYNYLSKNVKDNTDRISGVITRK